MQIWTCRRSVCHHLSEEPSSLRQDQNQKHQRQIHIQVHKARREVVEEGGVTFKISTIIPVAVSEGEGGAEDLVQQDHTRHRLAHPIRDGAVECNSNNNMTDRMLLFRSSVLLR